MNFTQELQQRKMPLEENLLLFLKEGKSKYSELIYDAMEYSVVAGGKRVRPILHLEIIRLLGGEPMEFIDSACALEYIHTYSLIHDDLPAMDNDDYRRGKLTNHKVFGEDIAILAGDGLLNLAYELLLKKVYVNTKPEVAKGALYIAQKAGVQGMIAGQVVDIKSEDKQIDYQTLEYIHLHKTSALIEASILSAAYMMNAKEEQIEMLEKYAKNLGLAFQISDDILDVEGDFSELGKPIQSDAVNHKTTFVSFYGLENAKQKLSEVVEEAVCAIKEFNNNDFLIELVRFMEYRKK